MLAVDIYQQFMTSKEVPKLLAKALYRVACFDATPKVSASYLVAKYKVFLIREVGFLSPTAQRAFQSAQGNRRSWIGLCSPLNLRHIEFKVLDGVDVIGFRLCCSHRISHKLIVLPHHNLDVAPAQILIAFAACSNAAVKGWG